MENLKDLRTLYIWDAEKISYAGVRHLAGLKNLEHIHINDSLLGDEALAIFGGLPRLETLSLQGGRFTDEGLKPLVGLARLKSLWLGRGESRFTDAAADLLVRLTTVEGLDLQDSRLSDAGVIKLAGLTNLRRLYVDGVGTREAPITDASVDAVSKLPLLEELMIERTRISQAGVRRLCELPKLSFLSVTSQLITDDLKVELRGKYPSPLFQFLRFDPERE